MLNFLVANATLGPPIRFVPHRRCFREQPVASNMHSSTSLRPTEWHRRRTACLNRLAASFAATGARHEIPLRLSNCSVASAATLQLLPRWSSTTGTDGALAARRLGNRSRSRRMPSQFKVDRMTRLDRMAARLFGH